MSTFHDTFNNVMTIIEALDDSTITYDFVHEYVPEPKDVISTHVPVVVEIPNKQGKEYVPELKDVITTHIMIKKSILLCGAACVMCFLWTRMRDMEKTIMKTYVDEFAHLIFLTCLVSGIGIFYVARK